jgi:hypothetical protein
MRLNRNHCVAATRLLFDHLLAHKHSQAAAHCVIRAMSHVAGNRGTYDPACPAGNTTYPSTVEGVLVRSYKV